MVIYKFIKSLILYIQHYRVLEQIYKEENLINNLSELFGARVKKDWIGRLYVVINPVAQKKQNEEILEFSDDGLTNKSFVEKWIMERLVAADNYIVNHNLFEVLTYEIKQLDEYQNFLFVTTPIAWFDFIKWTKWLLVELAVLIAAIVSCLIILL